MGKSQTAKRAFGLRMGAEVKFVQSIRRRVGAVGALLAALAVLVPYPADAQLVILPLPADLEANLPSELSNAIIPVLDGLQLPVNVAQTLGAICPAPLSSECSELLQTVAVIAPSTQQIITTASADSSPPNQFANRRLRFCRSPSSSNSVSGGSSKRQSNRHELWHFWGLSYLP